MEYFFCKDTGQALYFTGLIGRNGINSGCFYNDAPVARGIEQRFSSIVPATEMQILEKALLTIYRLYLNLLFAWWQMKDWLPG
jgi:hypothetical protein